MLNSACCLVKKFLPWQNHKKYVPYLVLFWKSNLYMSHGGALFWREIKVRLMWCKVFLILLLPTEHLSRYFLVPLSHAWYLMGFFSRTLDIFGPRFFFFNGLSLRWDKCYFCNISYCSAKFSSYIVTLISILYLAGQLNRIRIQDVSYTSFHTIFWISKSSLVELPHTYLICKCGANVNCCQNCHWCTHSNFVHKFILRRNSFIKLKRVNFLASIGGGDDPFFKRTSTSDIRDSAANN